MLWVTSGKRRHLTYAGPYLGRGSPTSERPPRSGEGSARCRRIAASPADAGEEGEWARTVHDLLSAAQVAAYGRYAEPPSVAQLEPFIHFDERDRGLVSRRRGDHNRLGFAVQLDLTGMLAMRRLSSTIGRHAVRVLDGELLSDLRATISGTSVGRARNVPRNRTVPNVAQLGHLGAMPQGNPQPDARMAGAAFCAVAASGYPVRPARVMCRGERASNGTPAAPAFRTRAGAAAGKSGAPRLDEERAPAGARSEAA
jgi:hypothetical protein